MAARLFRIHGHVQGVFFRAETLQKAQELGLRGWVRNVQDGTVEVWAEGDESSLDTLSKWLQAGPAQAKVEMVVSNDVPQRQCSVFEKAETIPAAKAEQIL